MEFRYRILEDQLPYTGRELRRGWVEQRTGLDNAAAVGFFGACHVTTADLVDLEDARAGACIESAEMAHIVAEFPGCSIRAGVLRQRLLVCILSEILRESGFAARRDGDDLYYDERKLTVSIAAPSPGSSLIHLGINVRPDGAPVPAVGLSELGLDARKLLEELLSRFKRELETAAFAETKVRTVD